MAGSWKHIVTTKKGKFQGTILLDHLGDAYEALEECYGMVYWLAASVAIETSEDRGAAPKELTRIIENARVNYRQGIEHFSPGVKTPS